MGVNFGPTKYPSYFLTAYGSWLKEGNEGTERDFLEAMKVKGDPGKSAYETARAGGYTGTEEEFMDKLANQSKSAYDYAVEGGYTGTPEEFSLKLATEYIPEINGIKPKPGEPFKLTAEDIKAQPAGSYASAADLEQVQNGKLDKAGGTVTGNLTIQGKAVVQSPKSNKEAANLGTVKTEIRESEKAVTVTLTQSGWSGKTQTVQVAGVTENSNGRCGPAGTAADVEAFAEALVYIQTQAAGAIVFGCVNPPDVDIRVNVLYREVKP